MADKVSLENIILYLNLVVNKIYLTFITVLR